MEEQSQSFFKNQILLYEDHIKNILEIFYNAFFSFSFLYIIFFFAKIFSDYLYMVFMYGFYHFTLIPDPNKFE